MKKYTKNPMYGYLMVLTICATAGLQVWRTLFDNFAVHVVGLNGFHVGIIQSVREIPGFLALLVVYVLLVVREHRLSAFSILVLGVGVAATGAMPTFYGLIFTTLIMSFGFHYFETTNQSLTLQYFDEKTSPIVFGRLKSLASASNICAGALIFIIAPFMTYGSMYFMFGALIIGGGFWALLHNPTDKNLVVQKKKMVFKRRYWLFYFLTFMAGARRQIFVAFAVFLLVRKFQFPVQWIAALFLVNNVVNYFLSPIIGKCIVRFGEQKVLSLEYFSMIIIFISYAVVDSKILVALLYIADHVFFNFAIAIRTFFQKIADPRDIAPSMAVGFTINHIAAVMLPAIGGMLWVVDYRIPFIGGAVFSLVSLVLVQMIGAQVKKMAS
ncbi:MAG: MFS transporter [Deltaproteobacteria bacterium]|nr:MFS transporter [Deltaproteobacteria bacterium]